MFTQHGLRVNGPLFADNPMHGPSSLLGAWLNNRPCVVKMLRGTVPLEELGEPADRESSAIQALMW